MENLLKDLRGKKIHIVGVTGAEGSSILRLLVKHNIPNITVHDFLKEKTIEKSFKLWHKGLSTAGREKLFYQFESDLPSALSHFGSDYLKDIESADIVFVPQSWRLYKKDNAPLWNKANKASFYSLTRLYLDFAPAQIIAVTGTVGKGSTANIIYQLLKKNLPIGRRVYFAGNDTWMPQLADKLDEMSKDDILVLEISHRQLQDGFTRAPNIAVITNLYPNHLDEVNWENYVNLKLSLVNRQTSSDVAILNYDIPQLRLSGKLNSKVIYFSERIPELNTKSIQEIYPEIMNNKSIHYSVNLLAGYTAVEIAGFSLNQSSTSISDLKALPARLEMIATVRGINIYDDIKSTTPWATMAAIDKLEKNIILICGGKTKGIDYSEFANRLQEKVKIAIFLKSEMSNQLGKLLPNTIYQEVTEFPQALQLAYKIAKNGDNILVSPAAGFFYSEFIKGKKSLRRLVEEISAKSVDPEINSG